MFSRRAHAAFVGDSPGVGAGYDVGTNTNTITLVGPDWLGAATGTAISVSGVTGVYTATVQLN